jgi:hypothetical protein
MMLVNSLIIRGFRTSEAGNAYKVFDLKGALIKEITAKESFTSSVASPSQVLDAHHIQNFFDGIKKGAILASDIVGGHQSTLLVQLGNIALRSGSTLNIDPKNGHIIGNKEAQQYWSRTYQKGWEPKA